MEGCCKYKVMILAKDGSDLKKRNVQKIKRRATLDLPWVPVCIRLENPRARIVPSSSSQNSRVRANLYLFSAEGTNLSEILASRVYPVNSPFGAGPCGLTGPELGRVRRLSDSVPFVSRVKKWAEGIVKHRLLIRSTNLK